MLEPHSSGMRNNALPFTIAITLTGCGTNPCDIGLLYENMTPEQQAACDQCGNANECPDEGETGDESPGLLVTVAADDRRYAFDGVLSQQVKDVMATPGGLVDIERGLDACFIDDSPAYRCNLGWDGQEAIWSMFGTENTCLACRGEGGINYIPFDVSGAWPACMADVSHGAALTGAWVHEGDPTCIPNAPSPTTHCPAGHVQIWEPDDPWTHYPGNNWTCRCPEHTDAQCQAGAVCEAAWMGNDGLWGQAQPTLCTWDDGEGDANGAAPEGPVVYSLTRWEDGFAIDGDDITITHAMLVRLWPQEDQPFALLNDDQRIDGDGTITHCGSESLCEHLGLHVGERIVLDHAESDVLALLAGESIYIEIQRPRARSRWLTLTLAE